MHIHLGVVGQNTFPYSVVLAGLPNLASMFFVLLDLSILRWKGTLEVSSLGNSQAPTAFRFS